ncbi:hypothetical protein BDB00DRAFT_866395 [Zychaea mexicana]|uniref:uncharacterized protein n=1 Tax=Zychaea mexicana TaxID=64656 RepID=UPI0022FE5FF2|nr:uncharacterized protein BDB00DRAFT_866395 [Zychaea mexicana]KAI9499522.1 hypothetical protein BDB00DRAFT_866395 [Zychaea mexicana]
MAAKAEHDAIAHITLLVMVQWISIAAIVLNAIALNVASSSSQGLIASNPGPQDYLLVVLGAISLLGASLLLCLHLHVFLQLMDNRPFAPSKTILASEMTTGVILIALWASATSIILTNYHVSSPCRLDGTEFVQLYGQACDLLNYSIVLAFAAVGGWLLVILATLFTLTRSSMHASVFTVENPYFTKQSASAFALCADSKSSTMQSIAPYQKPKFPSAAIVPSSATKKIDNSMDTSDSIRAIYNLSYNVHHRQQYDSKQHQKSNGKSLRGDAKSWCSDDSAATTAAGHDDLEVGAKASMESISFDDLPRIQVGMSRMNLSFFAETEQGQDKKTSSSSLKP